MTDGDTNRALGVRDPGPPDEVNAAYLARRNDLEERIAAAPTRALAEAYRVAIQELEANWVETTGLSPLPVATRGAVEVQPLEVSVRPTDGASAPDHQPPLPQSSGGSDANGGTGPPGGLEASTESTFDVPASVPVRSAGNVYTPKRLGVLGAVAAVGLLGIGAMSFVLLGLEDPEEVATQPGPLTGVTDPIKPSDTSQVGITPNAPPPVKPPGPAGADEADAVATRQAAEQARTAYYRFQRPEGMELPESVEGERLMRQGAESQATEDAAGAAACYRRAADLFAGASAKCVSEVVQAAGELARASVDRWNTVPPGDRGPWRARLDDATVRLNDGVRRVGEGSVEEGRAGIAAAGAALDRLWSEYLTESVRAARRQIASVLSDWDSLFVPLGQEGLSEADVVTEARARLEALSSGEIGAAEELAALRRAEMEVTGALRRLGEDRSAFEEARQRARQARAAFESAEKPEGAEFPGAARGTGLMDQAAEAVATTGLAGAAALYRQAAWEFAEASSRAAAVVVERAEAQKRATLVDLDKLRVAIDAAAEARRGAAERVAGLTTEIERLRALPETTDPVRADAARAELAEARESLVVATRVVVVAEAAGLTNERLASLREGHAGLVSEVQNGGRLQASVIREILAQAQALGAVVPLASGAVRAEGAARASAERWIAVPEQARRSWQARLDEAMALLGAGTRLLDGGKLEEGQQAIKAAGAACDSLWSEFMADSVGAARRRVVSALVEWDSLVGPTARAGAAEPAGVREARAVLASGPLGGTPPETELSALDRLETLVTGATSRVREERSVAAVAAAGGSGGDGLTLLQSAVRDGNAALVGELLKQGADVNTRGGRTEAALVMAVRAGRAGIAKALLDAGADRTQGASDGCPIAFLGAVSPEMLRLFLDEAGRIRHRGRTILHEIAACGVERAVKGLDQAAMADLVLQKHPGLLGEKDSLGLTALELARQRNARELILFLTQWESDR